MAGGYYLSDADRQSLRLLVSQYVSQGLDQLGRGRVPPGSANIYVARVGDTALPALTPKGSDAYDHPGVVACGVYQILPSVAAGEDWDLTPVSDFSVPVFNLTQSALATDQWLLVHRTKQGFFVASMGGGTSSSALVRFELIDDMLAGECCRAFLQRYYDDDPTRLCGYWETDTDSMIWVQDPARQLCGWGGWEGGAGTGAGGGWQRPAWCGAGTGTGTGDFNESNVGSVGCAYLPGDTQATAGTGTGTGTGGESTDIYEILWMVEPCEMFLAEVDGDVVGTDSDINILSSNAQPLNTSRNRRFWKNAPPTSVPNLFNWYVADGAMLLCTRESCHDYIPVQKSCPPSIPPG